MSAPVPISASVPSTGTNPDGWRKYWRVHGTNWCSLIELHFEICKRLQAISSSWSSS